MDLKKADYDINENCMKHLFIINPHSFVTRNSMNQVLTEIRECFSTGYELDYEIHISRYPRDAIAVIHRYIESVSRDEAVRVYAVGGDGTLFDCLNGMVDFPNAELTNVPYGSAYCFVLAFGPDAISGFRDIKKLISAPSHPVDIINYGSNYALIEANIGLIGQLVIYSNPILRGYDKKWTQRFVGPIYNISALRALFNKEVIHQEYTVLIDGDDESGCYSNIHISNSALTGSGMLASPYAVPDDGLLDVIYTCTSSKLNIARALGNYEKGLFEKYKYFRHRKFHTMEVKSDKPLRVQLDGESFFANEIKLEINPGAIRFFAPEGMNLMEYSDKAYKNLAREKKVRHERS